MNIWQLQEWAKKQDEEEPEFRLIVNEFGFGVSGRFINKGFGFVKIPALGEGVISLIHWAKEPNADKLKFEPIEN